MQCFRTVSGSLYFVDGDKLHRANEHVKILDVSGVESLMTTFVIERTIVAPTVGFGALFTVRSSEGAGPLRTSPVTEVSEVELPSWMLPEVS